VTQVFGSDGDADAALDAAEEALGRGQLVVIPTDTVYGLAARPDIDGATDRLFDAKRRPHDLTLPILVAGAADAAQVAQMDARALALAHRFWPGGLTLVLPRTQVSRGWDLGAAKDTIGVRVPEHGLAIALLARTGPLAVSSANRSGEKPASSCEGVRKSLRDEVELYLCVDGGGGTPSTILDLTGVEPHILRIGAVDPDEVLAGLIGRAPD